MVRVAVTGGKGGTGKTIIALNLAIALAKKHKVVLADCDVDCPNTYILADTKLGKEKPVNSFIPDFDLDKCTACGKCVEACSTNAIYLVNKKPALFEKLCSGCEVCKLVCPHDAVKTREKTIGYTYEAEKYGVKFIVGKLTPTEPISAKVVSETKERALAEKADFYIMDTSAGTHCDVIDALYGSDLAFVVTEPTPFGIHDLKLIMSVLEKLKIDSKIIVNRSDITELKIENTFLEIPYDEKMMECYAENIPIVVKYPKYKISKIFFELAESLTEKM